METVSVFSPQETFEKPVQASSSFKTVGFFSACSWRDAVLTHGNVCTRLVLTGLLCCNTAIHFSSSWDFVCVRIFACLSALFLPSSAFLNMLSFIKVDDPRFPP